MARGHDDAEPVPAEVVLRSGEERELVLAAVAGACVDVPQGKAASALGPRQAEVAAKLSEVAEQRQHQRSAQA
jgi:hypothetical protein